MLRRLAPLLLLLGLAPSARAVPITGYAFGYVVKDLSDDYPNQVPPRRFTFGERVTLRYVYDLDPPPPPSLPGTPTAAFRFITGGGLDVDTGTRPLHIGQGAWPDLRLATSDFMSTYELRFVGGVGTFAYEIDLPGGVAGFHAAVERTSEFLPVDAAVPEPSGLLLGTIGAVTIAASTLVRRRRTPCPARPSRRFRPGAWTPALEGRLAPSGMTAPFVYQNPYDYLDPDNHAPLPDPHTLGPVTPWLKAYGRLEIAGRMEGLVAQARGIEMFLAELEARPIDPTDEVALRELDIMMSIGSGMLSVTQRRISRLTEVARWWERIAVLEDPYAYPGDPGP